MIYVGARTGGQRSSSKTSVNLRIQNQIMGDKSPKAVNKQKGQKQKQAGAASQKKQAAAPKSAAPAKKK